MSSRRLKNAIVGYVYRNALTVSSTGAASQKKVCTVGVLGDFLEHTSEEIQQELAAVLDVSVAAITVVLYQEKKDKEVVDSTVVSHNDFGWNGRLVGVAAAEFVKKDFDLLINYSKAPNLYLNVLTLLSNAAFKIGFTQANSSLFDLTVTVPDCNTAVFHEEIKKYLTILNKL